MSKRIVSRRNFAISALFVSIAALMPALAAAEADRIIVEDPATGAVKFRVTTEGNITGGSFTGAPADGASVSIQQGPTEAGSVVKLAVKDSGSNSKFVINAKGYAGIGTSNPTAPITVDTATAPEIAWGSPVFIVQGAANRERFELRSLYAPVFQGRQFNGSIASPTATTTGKILMAFGGGGYDGTVFTGNKATFIMKAAEDWSTSAQGTYLTFETTSKGTSAAPSEKMRIADSGNVGIGTASPTQKLEVNGGVRINTTASKPTCDSTTRSTFWVTQGGDGVKDGVDICLKDAAGTYAWRTIW